MGRLEQWLDKLYPKVLQILDANTSSKTLQNYQPLWDEEREDINQAYCLKTDFDFKQANTAVQKNLHKMGEVEESKADNDY
jgi:hypothetical protein